jgi:hypothetical protein
MTDPYVLYYPPTNSCPFLLVFFSADGTITVRVASEPCHRVVLPMPHELL